MEEQLPGTELREGSEKYSEKTLLPFRLVLVSLFFRGQLYSLSVSKK
jgi:hypothetical protein